MTGLTDRERNHGPLTCLWFTPNPGIVDDGTLHGPWTTTWAVLVLVLVGQNLSDLDIRPWSPPWVVVLMTGCGRVRGPEPADHQPNLVDGKAAEFDVEPGNACCTKAVNDTGPDGAPLKEGSLDGGGGGVAGGMAVLWYGGDGTYSGSGGKCGGGGGGGGGGGCYKCGESGH
uniref:Cold shock domain protein 1 n=1 Tax=Solanum tuberosum TaxID=4113 RepID=M1DE27_SOLTU